MIEIFLLEQLVAFAKTGTLSQAALELHITQPALSRSMKKLEEELGVPLFDRSKSKIALNETGKVAAKYGERVLEADREMVRQILAFERSRRTFVFGSCATLPVNSLMPVFQEHFRGMAITSEIADDEKLIYGLKNHIYQIAVLHSQPKDRALFSQKYMEESLYVTFLVDHPLASAESISARDLEGLQILAHGGAGFWPDICRQNHYLCCLSGEQTRYEKIFKAAGCMEEQ